ncbi:MAG: hypothetical protein M3040_11210 [Bacteroidota bacterium]|nr:hypothetical protein [Bacteroidota bacterium]
MVTSLSYFNLLKLFVQQGVKRPPLRHGEEERRSSVRWKLNKSGKLEGGLLRSSL